MKAVWQGEVLAESEDTVVVEGNHYFPPSSVKSASFTSSDHTSFCPWKGTASYYDVHAAGKTNENAAWYYPDPMDAAAEIKDRIAFWKGVDVIE